MTQFELSALGVDRERWEAGLTLDAFVAGIDANQAATRQRLRDVQLAPEDVRFFANLTTPSYALAMTEGWCGDSLMNLPILARIVEATPGLDLRVFVRSQAPELSAAYLARGVKNIPVFTFFDADFQEIGTWIERSQAAHLRVAQWRAAHPEFDAIRHAPNLTDEERRAQLLPIAATLLPAMEQWYAESLQAATVAEIKQLLAEVSGSF